MTLSPSSRNYPLILVVIVLYKCELEASQSFSSLLEIFREAPALGERFSIVVYDNSPEPQTESLSAAVHYVHDSSNGGLATAYNFALKRAEEEHCEWLLLLDQDTSPT